MQGGGAGPATLQGTFVFRSLRVENKMATSHGYSTVAPLICASLCAV